MKIVGIVILLFSIFLSGCDTLNGVSRSADLHRFPDLPALKTRIESYTEIDHVSYREREGSRPLKLTGIKPANQVFYLHYSGGESVRGTLMFSRDYQGKVSYHQSLFAINRLPPQDWIDSTWPIMKRIESDLVEEFGFREIAETLHVVISRVQDPERNSSPPAHAPAPDKVRPPVP